MKIKKIPIKEAAIVVALASSILSTTMYGQYSSSSGAGYKMQTYWCSNSYGIGQRCVPGNQMDYCFSNSQISC